MAFVEDRSWSLGDEAPVLGQEVLDRAQWIVPFPVRGAPRRSRQLVHHSVGDADVRAEGDEGAVEAELIEDVLPRVAAVERDEDALDVTDGLADALEDGRLG